VDIDAKRAVMRGLGDAIELAMKRPQEWAPMIQSEITRDDDVRASVALTDTFEGKDLGDAWVGLAENLLDRLRSNVDHDQAAIDQLARALAAYQAVK
jgi:hypothetical protein